MPTDVLDQEDILADALELFGGKPVTDDDVIQYGPLILKVAQKQGKANTLLADHLFSPAIFLAEQIERDLLDARGRKVIELGAGCGLPSLLLSTKAAPPSAIVVTDYPDDNILGNLKINVELNQHIVTRGCTVKCAGYEWGMDASALLALVDALEPAYDIVILSDLVHFVDSHDALISSIVKLLVKTDDAKVYVGAGNYTHHQLCERFLEKAKAVGLIFKPIVVSEEDREWQGTLEVSTLDKESLALRKNSCRYWVGRW